MKGSEKQIAWADKIIAEHKAAANAMLEKLVDSNEKRPSDRKKKQIHEIRRVLELDWSNPDLDAGKIIDMRDRLRKPDFEGGFKYDVSGFTALHTGIGTPMSVIFGMDNDAINEFLNKV